MQSTLASSAIRILHGKVNNLLSQEIPLIKDITKIKPRFKKEISYDLMRYIIDKKNTEYYYLFFICANESLQTHAFREHKKKIIEILREKTEEEFKKEYKKYISLYFFLIIITPSILSQIFLENKLIISIIHIFSILLYLLWVDYYYKKETEILLRIPLL